MAPRAFSSIGKRLAAGVLLLGLVEAGLRVGGAARLLPVTSVAGVPAANGAPAPLLAPDLDGWCAGARLRTDRQGQRRNASAALERVLPSPLLAVGGELLAGVGLADDELWTAQLEGRLRTGGLGVDVVGVSCGRGRPARVRELLRSVRRPAPPTSSGAGFTNLPPHANGPDLLVLEIGPEDLGADARPFFVPASAPAVVPTPEASGLAALDLFTAWRASRARRGFEADVRTLVEGDGFTARAGENGRARLDGLTRALEERTPAPDAVGFLRALVRELYGEERRRERDRHAQDWAELFDQLRTEQRAAVLVVVGPTLLTLVVAQGAAHVGFPVVHAAPFELDPRLRIEPPELRPAAVVHAALADSVWAMLSKRNVLPAAAAAPPAIHATAAAIEQQFATRGGIEESLIALARQQLSDRVVFGGGPPPVAVLSGLGEGGALVPGAVAEVILARPSLARELKVRAQVAKASRPLLRIGIGTAEQVALPVPVEDGSSPPDRDLVEYRVTPPATPGIYEYPSIRIALEGPPSAGGSPLRLIALAFTKAPPSASEEEEDGR